MSPGKTAGGDTEDPRPAAEARGVLETDAIEAQRAFARANLTTLFALIVALGLILDDSLVSIENIYR